jgi:2'-5' RNA ligase
MMTLKEMLLERKIDQAERLGCLMAMVDESVAAKILEFNKKLIKEEDLYHKINDKGEDEFGREKECHVTIRYGFTKDLNELDVRQLLKGRDEFLVEVTGLDIFDTNPEFDVVKFDVESPVLKQLNEISGIYPNKSDFPDYHAHINLAYVKKGSFPYKKEIKLMIPIKSVCHSPINGSKSYFDLETSNTINEDVSFSEIDDKINKLEQEWERLDSTGNGSVRQQEISKEIERLKRIKEPRKQLNPNSQKSKDLWASVYDAIKL